MEEEEQAKVGLELPEDKETADDRYRRKRLIQTFPSLYTDFDRAEFGLPRYPDDKP